MDVGIACPRAQARGHACEAASTTDGAEAVNRELPAGKVQNAFPDSKLAAPLSSVYTSIQDRLCG